MGRWETMENALKAVDDVAEAWRRDRRELRDEINWLHAELHGAELEAEKLRGMLGCPLLDVGKRARQNGKHLLCERLMERNTELRELVDELYPLADYGAMDASELDKAHDLMRELGVEV